MQRWISSSFDAKGVARLFLLIPVSTRSPSVMKPRMLPRWVITRCSPSLMLRLPPWEETNPWVKRAWPTAWNWDNMVANYRSLATTPLPAHFPASGARRGSRIESRHMARLAGGCYLRIGALTSRRRSSACLSASPNRACQQSIINWLLPAPCSDCLSG